MWKCGSRRVWIKFDYKSRERDKFEFNYILDTSKENMTADIGVALNFIRRERRDNYAFGVGVVASGSGADIR